MSKKPQNSFWEKLKARNVIRVAIAYSITAWLLMQVASIVLPTFNAPEWVLKAVIFLLILGLPIALLMSWFFEMTSEGLKKSKSVTQQESELGGKKVRNLIYVVLSLSVLYLLYDKFFVADEIASSPIEKTVEVYISEKSIAVLPFRNMSETDDNIYFSDGIMEAILNDLSRIKDLKVVSRTSVEAYRDTDKRVPLIGQELEVAHVLEGSVQRIDNKVRITAQLIATKNDKHLWSENYDRELEDIFEIQSEIAATIADNLKLLISSELKEEMANAPTSNLMAYDLYLQANYLPNATTEDNQQAIKLNQQALELDPDFALPYVGIAGALLRLGRKDFLPKSIWRDSTLVLLDKAIALQPDTWQAYAVKANTYYWNGEYDKMNYYIDKVLEYNPNNAEFMGSSGQTKIANGNLDEGIDLILKSFTLIPGTFVNESSENIGWTLFQLDNQLQSKFLKKIYAKNQDYKWLQRYIADSEKYFRNYEGLVNSCEILVEWSPIANNINNLAEAYLHNQNFEKAVEYYEKRFTMSDGSNGGEVDFLKFPFIHRYGYALLMTGEKEKGLSLINSYKDILLESTKEEAFITHSGGVYYDLAVIYTSLDDKKEAIKWFTKASEEEKNGAFFRSDYLLGDTMLDPLRDEPAFKVLIDKKLAEEAKVTEVFRKKLKEYQDRGELLWLTGE